MRGRTSSARLKALLLVWCAQLSIQACHGSSKKAPSPLPSASQKGAGARLVIPEPRHDFGSIVQGSTLQQDFAVANAGTSPLAIDGVAPVFGCTGGALPRVLEPSARGVLQVSCPAETYGPLRVSLPIVSNHSGSDKPELTLAATVVPLLTFETALLEFRMAFGEERTAEVRLTGALADQARIQVKEIGETGFDVSVLGAELGKPAGLRIRAKGSKAGMHSGNIVVSTNVARPTEISLPYACRVQGTLEVLPTNPYFNLRVSGPKSQLIQVKSSQPDFAVRAVEIVEGPFTASLEAGDARGSFRVKVLVLEQQLQDETRSALGTLRIRSNDLTEPVKEIPLFAFGRWQRAPTESPGSSAPRAEERAARPMGQ